MDDIEIHEYKRIDLKDAIIIDGFPSVGLVSTITASYIVASLDMELIGVMDSVFFPTVSVVRDGEPNHPVRFYVGDIEGPSGEYTRLVVFLSEFQPPSNLIKMICKKVLDWAQEVKCATIISPEGLVIENEGQVMTVPGDDDEGVMEPAPEGPAPVVEEAPLSNGEKAIFGVASTPSGRDKLSKAGIPVFSEGLISGIPGVLMNEGKKRNFEVICLLAESRENIPDARAAAVIIEKLKSLIPHLEVDLTPLYAEAALLEAKMRGYQRVAKPGGKRAIPAPSMYG
ncbi:MAG: PAC2 family protein [Candidatus Thermoplasmatota archaeon]|jgi:uncharacterized protein|nr:PAC2 family protein [Candidatus Thermoplasmatota archaeon]